jgi:DNA-binding transcriptional ArsR family regulator
MPEPEKDFDSSRAELFEALGHPTRVKILEALAERPMGFAELRREVGIESGGHLQFHLGKLTGLVGTTGSGSYALTDEGREAIRVFESATKGSKETSPHASLPTLRGRNWTRPLIVGLLIAVIVLGGIAAYQQEQIASLSASQSSNTTMVNGASYYYEEIPSYAPNGTTIAFHGVVFTFVSIYLPGLYSNPENYTGQGSVRLSNGTLLNLNGKTVQVELTGFLVEPPSGNGTEVHYGSVMTTEVAITYPDGSHETYNGFNLTASSESGTIWLTFAWHLNLSIANPWFGQHRNPQVGIIWDYLSPQNDLVLLVSTSD